MRLPGLAGPALVGRESRLPVGRRRHQPVPPRSGEDVGGEEVPHHVPPGEPGRQRRHLQRGVLAQEFRQCLRVPALEGGREPVEYRPLPRVVRFGRVILGGQRPGQLGPGPPQPAVDRGRRGSQQFGHLGRGPAQSVPQDQHRPLPGRQVLLRRDQRQPDPGPRRDGTGRIGPVSGQQRVGYRLQPRHLRRRQGNFQVCGRPAETGRQRPPPAPLQRGQARVRGDPVQPRPHRGPPLEAAERPPRPQVRLLHQVLGLVGRAQHPVAVRQQLPSEYAGQLGEIGTGGHHCLTFAGLRPSPVQTRPPSRTHRLAQPGASPGPPPLACGRDFTRAAAASVA
jgi:hypothetical protein